MASNDKPARLSRGLRARCAASSAAGLPAAGSGSGSSPGQDKRPSVSLEELDKRLQSYRGHPIDAPAGASHRHSSSTATGCSSQTLDDSQDCACTAQLLLPPRPALWQWRFDICRWARQASDKPNVLHRRHGSLPGRPKPASPLFELDRPAAVGDLLTQHTPGALSIGQFMTEHASLGPFMPYVIDSGHNLPASPDIVPVNDPATQSLPPLAAAEYTMHISRLTYMVRSLQAIKAADPGFLSQTPVHLLLDLVMDLEQKFTLPRVDFLRGHASTIRAMGVHTYGAHESRDASCIVGRADAGWDAQYPPQSAMATVEHIKDMACAVSRARHAKSSTSAITHDGQSSAGVLSSHPTHDTSVLGDRLMPDGAFWTGLRESNIAATCFSDDSQSDDARLHQTHLL